MMEGGFLRLSQPDRVGLLSSSGYTSLFPVDGNSYLQFCLKTRSLGPAAYNGKLALSSCSPVKLLIEMAQALCCTSPASERVNAGLSPCRITAVIPTQGPPPAYPVLCTGFQREPRGTGLAPPVRPRRQRCKQSAGAEVGTVRCSGTGIKKYNPAFYSKLPGCQMAGKCCCCCPPFCLKFNVLSPAHPPPGASGSFN